MSKKYSETINQTTREQSYDNAQYLTFIVCIYQHTTVPLQFFFFLQHSSRHMYPFNSSSQLYTSLKLKQSS